MANVRIGINLLPAPYDHETLEALMTVVKPMVERAA